MKIKPCPKCGCCEYLATAHVTQTWLINQDGDFVESKTECDEVLHAPAFLRPCRCFCSEPCSYDAGGFNACRRRGWKP